MYILIDALLLVMQTYFHFDHDFNLINVQSVCHINSAGEHRVFLCPVAATNHSFGTGCFVPILVSVDLPLLSLDANSLSPFMGLSTHQLTLHQLR